jgi:hypothetical protein
VEGFEASFVVYVGLYLGGLGVDTASEGSEAGRGGTALFLRCVCALHIGFPATGGVEGVGPEQSVDF